MLRLRTDQLAAFDAAARELFVAAVAAFLREKLPDAVARLTSGELHKAVAAAITRAESYGLTRRVDVRGFVTFCFGIGPAFDRHPAVEAILRDESLPADEKIDYLVSRITPAEWEEARRLV